MNAEPMELTFIHLGGNASLADLEKLGALNGINASNKNAQPQSPPATAK
jgi:hypothetical protein